MILRTMIFRGEDLAGVLQGQHLAAIPKQGDGIIRDLLAQGQALRGGDLVWEDGGINKAPFV